MIEQLPMMETLAEPVPFVIGLLLLVFGWLALRASLAAVGLVVGAGAGLLVHHGVTSRWLDDPGALMIAAVVWAVVGALVGVWLMSLMRRFGFFLAGAAVGAACWALLGQQVPPVDAIDPDLLYAMGFPIVGGIGGLLFLLGERWVAIVGSAAVGALLTCQGLDWPLGPWPALPLAGVGMLIQFWMTRGARDEE